MAKYLGIDVGSSHVRVVLLRTSYRRITIEAMTEYDRRAAPTLDEVVRMAASPLVSPGESVSVNLEGEKTFIRRIDVPAAAQKQLTEVLPYELEAELPFELSEAVYDYAILKRVTDDAVPVFAVVARTEDVRARIALVKDAIGEEPERVSPGGLALASLAAIVPEIAGQQTVALFDLEPGRSELVILERGEPVFARTLSRGTEGLPQSAPLLIREFRQSLAAWRMSGGARPEAAFLVGPGASTPNAREFLQEELDLPIAPLPAPRLDETKAEDIAQVPRFAKAVSLALALGARGRGYNLRRGALTYERGYGFLRERVPLLAGLFVVVIVSFFFSTWAELHALAQEKATLEAALTTVTGEVLGEATSDPQRATDLLDRTATGADEDPLPHADAFDVMVQIAQAVPETMTHDIEELDVQRGHVTVHGIVPTIPDAQQIATQLKSVRCFQDVKITRTNQVVGEERQKYVMELDVKCPVEGKEKPGAGAPAASASGGKP
ncbi:MAG TPA: pilus assembly protein PilM [Polyangiaceae bacterium]|nr:pilus assembly protein PilM [Polyangiaceae bacterium]